MSATPTTPQLPSTPITPRLATDEDSMYADESLDDITADFDAPAKNFSEQKMAPLLQTATKTVVYVKMPNNVWRIGMVREPCHLNSRSCLSMSEMMQCPNVKMIRS